MCSRGYLTVTRIRKISDKVRNEIEIEKLEEKLKDLKPKVEWLEKQLEDRKRRRLVCNYFGWDES